MTQETIKIEDGAMPDGWEPERFGFPKEGETIVSVMGQKTIVHQVLPGEIYCYPQMIIRKKYDPGIDCIPKGWWVWKGRANWLASSELGDYNSYVAGLQFLPSFVPPEDGQPRQIK